jgi:hypothetical protein
VPTNWSKRIVNGTFTYLAYGLSIQATMPLPELVAGETEREQEVSIRFGCVDGLPSEILEKGWGSFSPAPHEDYLFWQGVGSFLVRGGRDIVVDPSPELEENVLRLFILGPVLAVLLHQRGHLLLHASAVAVADEAVLFLGDTGWGKSTMAAALYARGYSLITDDVAALKANERCPMLVPGFPQLKLWPEALVSLGEDPETLSRCNPHFEKRARPVTQDFSLESIPIKRIYVLDKGDTPKILPLGPQEALGELIRHTYGGLDVGSSSHFLRCASIVNQVVMCSLRRKKSLLQLSNLVRFIEDDLAQST